MERQAGAVSYPRIECATAAEAVCEICRGTKSHVRFRKREYPICWCDGCGHVFTLFEGSDADLRQAYAEKFFVDGPYLDYVADRDIMSLNFQRFADALRGHCPEGRLLDIGCAYGFFLDVARHYWTVKGIDIDATAVAHARQQLDVDAVRGDFLQVDVPTASLDIVTMWDTIEHLRHPSQYLSKIAQVLRPGGVLAFTTGDVASMVARLRGRKWRLYDPPFHLHYFSRRTARSLLDKYGFRILEMRSTGYHRSVALMLHRLMAYERSGLSRRLFRAAAHSPLLCVPVYLNLFDIMFVVAQKPA